MGPAGVNTPGKCDVHKRAPPGTLWFPEKLHTGFVRKSVSLAGVAGDARANYVFPCGLPTAVARQHMVDVKVGSFEAVAAILAGVFVALEDIVPRKLHIFFGQSVEEAEHDDPRYADPERNGLEHPRFGIGEGKMSPT